MRKSRLELMNTSCLEMTANFTIHRTCGKLCLPPFGVFQRWGAFTMKLFCCKVKEQDWSKYFGGVPPQSRKQKLLDECAHHDVSVHIDDASESSADFYANCVQLRLRLNSSAG